MAPTGSPGITGAPIAENKVVPTTEGVPIDLNKPLVSIAARLFWACVAAAAAPGSPILAYNPVASEPTP